MSEPANFAATVRRGLNEYQPALNTGHTSASNSDLLGTRQAIGRVETLPEFPGSGLRADLMSNLVKQGCRFIRPGLIIPPGPKHQYGSLDVRIARAS